MAKKKNSKLANFFSNPKYVVLTAFVIVFAGIGAYKLYPSHAASKSAQDCKNAGTVIGLRSSGPCVTTLQNDINVINNNKSLSVDGYYGSATVAAVKTYQSRHGLRPDGVVGPLTWSAIIRDMSSKTRFGAN